MNIEPYSATPSRKLASVPKPKVSAKQQMKIEQRAFRSELDDQEQRERDDRNDREPDDERRSEPVVLVAFFEHRLQRAETDRHADNANPVALAQQAELHRRRVERDPEHAEHDDTRHEVDVEDVLPAVIVVQPAADCRPDRRGEGRRDGKQRHADGLLGRWQHGHDNGESHRDQHAAGKPLQRPQHDHLTKIVGHAHSTENTRNNTALARR